MIISATELVKEKKKAKREIVKDVEEYVIQDPGSIQVESGSIPPEIGQSFGESVNQIQLPCQPLYDLQLAADLIPCSMPNLMARLAMYKQHLAPRYRIDEQRRRRRLLSSSEIHFLRGQILRGPGRHHYSPINLPEDKKL